MPRRVNRIDKLVINSPYEEPAKHWSYDREHRLFTLEEGRRSAGYVVSTPNSRGFDDPGKFVELPLVNRIRPLVNAWVAADCPGATGTTRRLLSHWKDAEQRDSGKRLFFCGLEAIETLMWLTESPPGQRAGIDIPGDGGPFPRWCTKLATGGGKTNVMAMLIAWQVLNKVVAPDDPRFGRDVLVVAPGLTVRNRLAVLQPDGEGNFYDEFRLIPTALREPFRLGRVKVLNWHKLDWESDEQIARRRSVVKLGAKSDEAYARSVLDEMADARDLLVVNDEAHHAWRIPEGTRVTGASRQDREEATKWVGGLDRIHSARGVKRCYDFSATPFIPVGDKSPEEAMFGWIVSDFGLNDAIEAGLVKTPRVVVRDNALPDPKSFKSKLYHIYNDDTVKDDLNRKARPEESLPDLVMQAYHLLGADWLAAKKQWEKAGASAPPVMITVTNRTETAARIKYAFDHGKIAIAELCDPARTLHIDSKVLDDAEKAEDKGVVIVETSGDDDDGPEKKLTKEQQALLLRETVDTVGQRDKPGELIQNVISVAMLSEGWDAKTVTHIMGLRAFTSQLLCEQVVGRGLRRTSYEIDPDTLHLPAAEQLFKPEYVNVFGVPFSFLPHEEDATGTPAPPQPRTIVEPLPEREKEFAIRWPNVVRIEHEFRPRLTLDVDAMPVLQLNASETVVEAELAKVIGGRPEWSSLTRVQLEELIAQTREQTLLFKIAHDVLDQVKPTWKGTREVLMAQLVAHVARVLASNRIEISQPLFHTDPKRRLLMQLLHMNRIVRHVVDAIRDENTDRLRPIFDKLRPVLSTADMQPWYTARPCGSTARSHISVCVYDGTWEAAEAYQLDRSPRVDAWAKNDHLGFDVLYSFNGAIRRFRPDFLVRLKSGVHLVLEVKGRDDEEQRAKRRYLREWCQAVTAEGGFGEWRSDVSLSVDDLESVLQRASSD